MVIISPKNEEMIRQIRDRLDNSVTEIQIRNWLENFQPSDMSTALQVLSKIRYFSLSKMIQQFEEFFSKIIQNVDVKEKIFLHGLGNYGKSGMAMIYLLRKTKTYQDFQQRIKIIEHPNKLTKQGLKNGSALVLVDDFIGTGKSIISYYTQQLGFQFVKEHYTPTIFIMCSAYMVHGKDAVLKKIPQARIFGNPMNKAFADRGSVFGYRPKMLPMRHFAYKYGINIFSTVDWTTKLEKKHPLGFDNSQSLVVFAHSVPNNVLPIFWSSKGGWYPLFVRGYLKPSEIVILSVQRRIWFVRAQQIGLVRGGKYKSVYLGNIDFAFLTIIWLKRKRLSSVVLMSILDLTMTEYEEIISQFVQQGWLLTDENLTERGLELYLQSKTLLYFHKEGQNSELRNLRLPEHYVPKIFLGKR